LVWRLPDVAPDDVRLPKETSSSTGRWLWVVAGSAGIAGVVLLLQTRSSRSRQMSKEQS